MFCPKCGANAGNANFCSKCGYNLGDVPVDLMHSNQLNQQPHPPAPRPVSVPPKKKKRRGCFIGIGVFLIAVIIIAVVSSTIASKYPYVPQPAETSSAGQSKASPEQATNKKAEAKKIDDKTWEIFIDSIKRNNEIMKGVSGLSDGSMDSLEVYNYCKDAESSLGHNSTVYPLDNLSSDSDAYQYVSEAQKYTTDIQIIAQSVCKYIDSQKTSDLSKVTEYINIQKQAMSVVINNRSVYLKKAGFSEKEITAVINQLDSQLGK